QPLTAQARKKQYAAALKGARVNTASALKSRSSAAESAISDTPPTHVERCATRQSSVLFTLPLRLVSPWGMPSIVPAQNNKTPRSGSSPPDGVKIVVFIPP